MGSSSAAVIGVLSIACGILFTLPRVYCDEFTDENRPYEFGFTIEGQQHRHEKKDANGIIKGEFGFITADGIYHVTVYATDENGNFKILSMKNIRVSPPLDGSAPYNPSLQGSTGSKQQASRIPASGLVPSQAPVTAVTSRSTAAQPVTPTVKLFTGCSGCKIPVTTSPQALGNYPTEHPRSPSDLSNPYTTQSSILTQDEYPNTYRGTNAPSFQAAGEKGTTHVKISDDNVPPTVNNVAQSFPGSGKVPSTYKFSAVPEIIKPTVSPVQPTGNQGIQPSKRPPYPNGQYQTSRPLTIPSNQGQKPSPVLVFEEIHPSPGTEPINEQNVKGFSIPTSVPTSNQYFPSTVKGSVYTPNLTKPLGDQINNAAVPPTLQQQNNSLLQFDTSLTGVEKDGLPPGITVDDIKAILYKFNYTVGFHGHYESGYRNGDKLGAYFFNGRDGFGRNVQYTANEFGYQPNITLVELGLDSKDTPKEETEKQFGLRGYEFKWFYRK